MPKCQVIFAQALRKVGRVTKEMQEKQPKKVLVTGASGLIGGLVLEGLGHKYELSALNRRRVESVPCHQADISDLEAILPAFEGIHTVVHLAAYTQGAEWAPLLAQNIVVDTTSMKPPAGAVSRG